MSELVAVAADGDEITPLADDLLVQALADGLTYEAAAVLAGVSPRTVARRMGEASFRQRVAEAEREVLEISRRSRIAAARQLAERRGGWIIRLDELTKSENEMVALKATVELLKLDHTIGSGVELQALIADRLDVIEAHVGIADGRAM